MVTFVGIILENELAGNGVGRDSIVPDKYTLSVYRKTANIAGRFINSEMFIMLLSTHTKTALWKRPWQ